MSKAKYFWNRMAKSYDKQVEKKYKQAYSDTIVLSKKYLRSDFSVLDLACGTGLTTIDFSTTNIYDKKFDGKKYDAIFAFNILYFLEDIDLVLERIKSLLSPTGVFISVTDCLGEKKSLKRMFLSVLSASGLMPYMKSYSINALENIIRNKGFEIKAKQNLNADPPNHFIVAQKNIEK